MALKSIAADIQQIIKDSEKARTQQNNPFHPTQKFKRKQSGESRSLKPCEKFD